MKAGTCVWKACAVAMLFVGIVGPVRAQDYPTRAITVVVPFPPGGASDVVARIVTNQMSKILGQSIVIENVSGAGRERHDHRDRPGGIVLRGDLPGEAGQ